MSRWQSQVYIVADFGHRVREKDDPASGPCPVPQAGCNVPMLPGDLLITREDVWHRTQDIEQDRYLFKLDVRRSPIANDMREASVIGAARFGISEASDTTLS